MSNGSLAGRCVLILEDEFLIAMDVEQICLDYGARATHIVHNLEQMNPGVLDLHPFDAAVLDLRIGGTSTIPFAELLADRGIPFIFATGMGQAEEISERFPGVAVVPKPYSSEELVRSLAAALNGRGGLGEGA